MSTVMLCALILPSAGLLDTYAASNIWTKNETVKYSGGKQTVRAVYVNLKNPKLKIDVVPASGKVGQAEPLSKIAKSMESKNRTVVAAINGTFFDAYTKTGPKQPWGTIIRDGKALHVSNQFATIGFTKDLNVKVDRLKVSLDGDVSDNGEWSNSWYAWNINHVDPRDEAIVIFTSAFGKTTGKHTKSSIIVDKGKVTKVKTGEVDIPKDGFVVVTNDTTILERLQVGYAASFRQTLQTKSYEKDAYFEETSDWKDVQTAVSAGPTLMKNGKMIGNGEEEGFKESKITKSRGQRSFIGVKKDKTLVMGTVSGVTIKELAEITKNMGLVDAINLDGGASSGLYYEGKYIHTPGRDISNALVFSLEK